MPHPEEEYQISRDKGQVMDAIAAFFAWADDNVRAGKSLKFCWSRCWNLAGWNLGETLLEPRQNLAGKSVDIAGTLVEPGVAGTFGWDILLGTNLGVDFVFLFAFLALLTVSGYDVGSLA